LAYYQTVGSGAFDEAIEAIIRFARADVARFRLRDSLRAQALVPLVQEHPSSYIESGLIHYQLWRLLRARLPSHVRVQPLFLADAALSAMGEKGHFYGPGDQLTLLYLFHPAISLPEREKLLAARSIIYSKILEKSVSVAFEEINPEDWAEKVYRPDILENEKKLYKKPGYNPFE
jgi:hypothetical protein